MKNPYVSSSVGFAGRTALKDDIKKSIKLELKKPPRSGLVQQWVCDTL